MYGPKVRQIWYDNIIGIVLINEIKWLSFIEQRCFQCYLLQLYVQNYVFFSRIRWIWTRLRHLIDGRYCYILVSNNYGSDTNITSWGKHGEWGFLVLFYRYIQFFYVLNIFQVYGFLFIGTVIESRILIGLFNAWTCYKIKIYILLFC